MIDRVAESLGRTLVEVPVGFWWFVPGLFDGSVAFGGEESAGASFLRKDGGGGPPTRTASCCACWRRRSARSPEEPVELYADLVARFGDPAYERTDAAHPRRRRPHSASSTATPSPPSSSGDRSWRSSRRRRAMAAVGGVKVATEHAWLAARPSGTEDVYKIYAESFKGPEHLAEVQAEAKRIVDAALTSA